MKSSLLPEPILVQGVQKIFSISQTVIFG